MDWVGERVDDAGGPEAGQTPLRSAAISGGMGSDGLGCGRYCAAAEAVPPQGSDDMGKAMRILALLGVLAAAYFAYRYGVR